MWRRLLLHLLAAIAPAVTGLGYTATATTAADTYDYDHLAAPAPDGHSNALRLAGSRAPLDAPARSAVAAVRFPTLADVAAESETEAAQLLAPGPYARESIPARGPGRSWRKAEQDQINELGERYGCHTCGTRDPGTETGNWVLDHQLPSSINPAGEAQRLYPQCLGCSREQGLALARLLRLTRRGG